VEIPEGLVPKIRVNVDVTASGFFRNVTTQIESIRTETAQAGSRATNARAKIDELELQKRDLMRRYEDLTALGDTEELVRVDILLRK
jgi:hypothetical protein